MQHVGVLHHQFHLSRIHHFGDHRHVVLVAHIAQDLQPLFAHALVGVRAGTRLERPTAQDVRPAGLHVPRHDVHDLVALHGTRPRNHRQAAAADFHLAHVHDAVFLVELAAGELERLHDRQGLFHVRNLHQHFGLRLRLVADDADDGAAFAPAHVRSKAEFLDAFDDMVDLFERGIRLYNENHDEPCTSKTG